MRRLSHAACRFREAHVGHTGAEAIRRPRRRLWGCAGPGSTRAACRASSLPPARASSTFSWPLPAEPACQWGPRGGACYRNTRILIRPLDQRVASPSTASKACPRRPFSGGTPFVSAAGGNLAPALSGQGGKEVRSTEYVRDMCLYMKSTRERSGVRPRDVSEASARLGKGGKLGRCLGLNTDGDADPRRDSDVRPPWGPGRRVGIASRFFAKDRRGSSRPDAQELGNVGHYVKCIRLQMRAGKSLFYLVMGRPSR